MSTHSSCPHCHNTTPGIHIYKCPQCDKIFVVAVEIMGYLDGPKCNGSGTRLGQIKQ